MKPTGTTKEATVTIYRVSDSIDGKRHFAYSATHPSFCGRVGGGPKRQWLRTICKASIPTDKEVCRQCQRSPLNQVAPIDAALNEADGVRG